MVHQIAPSAFKMKKGGGHIFQLSLICTLKAIEVIKKVKKIKKVWVIELWQINTLCFLQSLCPLLSLCGPMCLVCLEVSPRHVEFNKTTECVNVRQGALQAASGYTADPVLHSASQVKHSEQDTTSSLRTLFRDEFERSSSTEAVPPEEVVPLRRLRVQPARGEGQAGPVHRHSRPRQPSRLGRTQRRRQDRRSQRSQHQSGKSSAGFSPCALMSNRV